MALGEAPTRRGLRSTSLVEQPSRHNLSVPRCEHSARATSRGVVGPRTRTEVSRAWNFTVGVALDGLFHPGDPAAAVSFQFIHDGEGLVGMLAEPGHDSKICGLVVTSPGAGGGPGPADPFGGGGGGTYGGALAYLRLAEALPKRRIAVLLLHYPDGNPGARGKGVPRTIDQMEDLVLWYQQKVLRSDISTVLIGWSMGGAVAIETAARMLTAGTSRIVGVATIASQTGGIQSASPKVIVNSGASLLLMVGAADSCLNPVCTEKIAKMAGVTPEIFPGEEHDVESALGRLTLWIPEVIGEIVTFARHREFLSIGNVQQVTPAATDRGRQAKPRSTSPPRRRPLERRIGSPQQRQPTSSSRDRLLDSCVAHGIAGEPQPESTRVENTLPFGVPPRRHTACWDSNRKSPDVVVHEGGSAISVPNKTRAVWHAAFLQTTVSLQKFMDPLRIEFLLENAGGGFVEIGIATRNVAKRAALHWPGLRNTCAWTYASSGDAFFNVIDANESMWCRPLAEVYRAGDRIGLELGAGSLRFYRNGSVQFALTDTLPAGKLYCGATLSAGGKLKLLGITHQS